MKQYKGARENQYRVEWKLELSADALGMSTILSKVDEELIQRLENRASLGVLESRTIHI